MNQPLIIEMRTIAQKLLAARTVGTIIGWEKGSRWYLTPPAFIHNEDQVDRLYFDRFAVNNLAKYLLDYRDSDEKVAVFVKGCDSRGIIRLIQDNQVKKENIIVIGLPCAGMYDRAKVEDPENPHDLPLLNKCLECRYPNPVYADRLVGEVSVSSESGRPTGTYSGFATAQSVGSRADRRFEAVDTLNNLPSGQKALLWQTYAERCLRCYACRNICPACNCAGCIFDSDRKQWTTKAALQSANSFFLVTRAMHVAERCVECGECERVCPAGIPVMSLNRLVSKEINRLCGAYDAGIELKSSFPLSHFNLAVKVGS
ncbi:4Fe-4S ferredoxin-type, iron-sulphur binding domain protein [Acididesulfobacillus acetoxydans]|uniref:4Fe-4S ferredoxin, iron-sulfur binding protein n=1 Tax=Acididesulfobacillus acetoxydans TaxID=1561005 RepID=A0A8S0X1Z8_9FIRM|nr:4Fe-4S dicluster domain-containing protein [Acididesulfobacillus acetoxydans]CAA7603351.1 4Fe-4S ferredoxin-type, iron-sulphur binding domain protein [Acididesulfobacillus acetoxydans]CEJ09320.1 4Fe-4S ferredoxin, iron-sulfur binding protein [Acididesulfobacillus acetoxydans]